MGRPGTFQPGNNANPRGRPKKGTALTDLLRTYLNTKDPEQLVARKKLLAAELYRRAVGGFIADPSDPNKREYVRGSDDLLRYLYDRIDGKPDIYTHVDDSTIPQIIVAGPAEPPDA